MHSATIWRRSYAAIRFSTNRLSIQMKFNVVNELLAPKDLNVPLEVLKLCIIWSVTHFSQLLFRSENWKNKRWAMREALLTDLGLSWTVPESSFFCKNDSINESLNNGISNKHIFKLTGIVCALRVRYRNREQCRSTLCPVAIQLRFACK